MKKIILPIVILFFVGCSERQVVYVDTKNPTITSSQKIQKPYEVFGKWYYPHNTYIGYKEKGVSSWYGPNFHGKLTANGEVYDMHELTAAHKTLPLGTIIKVTNLRNNKSVIVRINDRGPFVKNRILDLSYAAGKKINIHQRGTTRVEIEVVDINKNKYVKDKIVDNKSPNLEYNIQLGAFKNRSGAEIFKSEYSNLDNPIKIIKKDGVYKVYFTGFKNYDKAYEFKTSNNINGFIVTVND
jgi:rare lipoprotein A